MLNFHPSNVNELPVTSQQKRTISMRMYMDNSAEFRLLSATIYLYDKK